MAPRIRIWNSLRVWYVRSEPNSEFRKWKLISILILSAQNLKDQKIKITFVTQADTFKLI